MRRAVWDDKIRLTIRCVSPIINKDKCPDKSESKSRRNNYWQTLIGNGGQYVRHDCKL